jgi:hypothetical protein
MTDQEQTPNGGAPEPNGSPTPPEPGPGKAEAADSPTSPDPQPHGGDSDWQAKARRWERQAKANAEAAETLKRLQQAMGGEAGEPLEQQVAQARQQVEAARHEALRYRVALETGLPADLAVRLVGDDEDSLRKDAKALQSLVKPRAGTPDASTGTNAPPPGPASKDPNDLLRSMVSGR